jgi:hypothetical protein
MLPLSDGIPARRFPIVTITIIAANVAVWLFYELSHLDSMLFGGVSDENVEDAFPANVRTPLRAPI